MPDRRTEITHGQRFVVILLALVVLFGAAVVVPLVRASDNASQGDVLKNRQVGLQNQALLRDIDLRMCVATPK